MYKLLIVVGLCFAAGCVLFDDPGFTDDQGVFHPGEKGVVTRAAEGAGAASGFIPILGPIAGLLGAVAGAGAEYRRRKANKEAVKVMGFLKEKINDINTKEQLNKFLNDPIVLATGWGKQLKKMHTKLKIAA